MQAAIITAGISPADLVELLRPMVRHELEQLQKAAPATAESEDLLTMKQATDLLGVSAHTLHEWKRIGKLPYYKLGSRTFFKRDEIMAALQVQQRTAKKGGIRG